MGQSEAGMADVRWRCTLEVQMYKTVFTMIPID